jgi:putative SOS response-associated peptidase YedK
MGTTLRWDLIPNWAKDPKIAYKTINARAETLDTAPSYRQAFKKRRCLIPVDGFYEWKVPGGKIPYSISMKDDSPFVFAGLWEGWKDPANGEWLHTCTIITGEPNEFVRENPFKPNVDLIDRPSAREVSAAMRQPQRGVDMARGCER